MQFNDNIKFFIFTSDVKKASVYLKTEMTISQTTSRIRNRNSKFAESCDFQKPCGSVIFATDKFLPFSMN